MLIGFSKFSRHAPQTTNQTLCLADGVLSSIHRLGPIAFFYELGDGGAQFTGEFFRPDLLRSIHQRCEFSEESTREHDLVSEFG